MVLVTMRWILIVFVVTLSCEGQRPPSLPITTDSFTPLTRGFSNGLPGRPSTPNEIIIRHYSTNMTSQTAYRIDNIKALLLDPGFHVERPTVLYVHGFAELATDESIATVMTAYLRRGDHNVLLLDWANVAYGNYFICLQNMPRTAEYVGRMLGKLLKKGLPLKNLHMVGHSLGGHLIGSIARELMSRGHQVPRLTALDPAYPGFYPPLAASPLSPSDAAFVDVIHTDGGGFGSPTPEGHADFWPNGGTAKQPGCLSATIPLTREDFCSHWRSWQFFAESLSGDAFLARPCADYDMFVKGGCREQPMVLMGLRATPDLRGNFYLRTGSKSPFGLNLRGAS